jgi:D-alanyl-lipoteichoic acid acyltransferase DltB (MBOAT superfamily)
MIAGLIGIVGLTMLFNSAALRSSLSWQDCGCDVSLLALGIAFNIVLLDYFKYATFLVTSFAEAANVDWQIPHVILPLAISFFTFQQIAYLE